MSFFFNNKNTIYDLRINIVIYFAKQTNINKIN